VSKLALNWEGWCTVSTLWDVWSYSFKCELTQKYQLFFVESLEKTKNSNENVAWKQVNFFGFLKNISGILHIPLWKICLEFSQHILNEINSLVTNLFLLIINLRYHAFICLKFIYLPGCDHELLCSNHSLQIFVHLLLVVVLLTCNKAKQTATGNMCLSHW